MYTESDRENILNTLIDNFKNREETLSIILVGSASIGFRDRYSDLDLAIVVDSLDNIDTIFEKTIKEITDINKIVSNENMKERNLQIFLLNNYLEIDIGYYTLDTIYARRKNYKVIYDKTNKVDNIMKESLSKINQNKGTTNKVDMKKVIEYIDSILWYNVFHTITSFIRNDKYRSYYELNDLRNITIDLIGKRFNLETKKHREINNLPIEYKNKIDELYIYPQDKEELKELLLKNINLIYEQLDYFKKEENINYEISKEFLINYALENL